METNSQEGYYGFSLLKHGKNREGWFNGERMQLQLKFVLMALDVIHGENKEHVFIFDWRCG